MSPQLFTALAVFALVSSVTPGPNNLMLMTSGTNYGFRRTVPHMLGIALGFPLMVLLTGTGITGLFDAWPASYVVLKVISVLYLLYLAFCIATAAAPDARSGDDRAKPMSFPQAAAFQWVNPKGWFMALTAVSVYSPEHDLQDILIITLVFGIVLVPSAGAWIVLGQQIRKLLRSPVQMRFFNITMALLLVASLYPVLLPGK